jgi:hypothetical protein
LAPGTYIFTGDYSSDNMVVSFLVNNHELITGQPTHGVFEYQYSTPVTITSSNPSVKLAVTVWNSFQTGAITPYTFNNGVANVTLTETPGYSQNAANPTGFILAGSLTAVPLPASAWSGLGLLGLIGAARLRSRKALEV